MIGRAGRRGRRRGRLSTVVGLVASLPAMALAQAYDPRAVPPTTPGAGNPAVIRLDTRVTQVEEDVRAVTGRIEELSFQIRQLEKKLDRIEADLEVRFNQLRDPTKAAAEPPAGPRPLGAQTATPPSAVAAPPPAAPTPPPSAPAASTATASATPPASVPATTSPQGPKEQYARAFSQLQQANYDGAAAGFSDFLRQYPNDALADNARYWLGETYYARGDYPRAAETFLDGYEKNKTGPKAPDTLLKLGMALGNLNKKSEACATFKELNRAFPEAPAAIKEKAAQESRKNACP